MIKTGYLTLEKKQPIELSTKPNKSQDAKNQCFSIGKTLFLDLEEVQLTPDLKDDATLYHGFCLPCKIDQRYCVPVT